VVFFGSIDADVRVCAQHRDKPVAISVADRPGDLLTDAEWLPAALHLPAIDPDT
jgi:hypothetical protein